MAIPIADLASLIIIIPILIKILKILSAPDSLVGGEKIAIDS
jgi:uncharacterized membrane protein YvbJ